MHEKFGNITGQVGKMKVANIPQNFCKQTMQNSSELAESRRHLTANVEKKWLRNLHENVNSANSQNAIIRSGTLLESRKCKLPLPKPLSLDAFSAQMAPHLFGNPDKALHDSAHPDILCQALPHLGEPLVDFKQLGVPSVDFMRPDEPSVALTGLMSLVTSSGALCRGPVNTRSLGPTGQSLPQNQLDLITLLVPFRRFQVMCSTRFKQIPLRTCRTQT